MGKALSWDQGRKGVQASAGECPPSTSALGKCLMQQQQKNSEICFLVRDWQTRCEALQCLCLEVVTLQEPLPGKWGLELEHKPQR